jgi:enterochelin esterase-like enzyme
VIATTFRSGILKNEGKLWIYTPSGFSKLGARYPLLVLFDRDRNVKWVPAILDNLIAQKLIPPMVAALIDNPSTAARNLELPCYPPFADFLATELIPWVRENYNGAAEAARTIAAGSSYGGLAAVFGGLRHPEVFGKWCRYPDPFGGSRSTVDAEWLIRQVADAPNYRCDFIRKWGLWKAIRCRSPRTGVAAKGYATGYAEYDGGHSFVNWSGGTANGLLFLMGSIAD